MCCVSIIYSLSTLTGCAFEAGGGDQGRRVERGVMEGGPGVLSLVHDTHDWIDRKVGLFLGVLEELPGGTEVACFLEEEKGEGRDEDSVEL